MDEFVSIDFETANPQRCSICQIGISKFGADGLIETWGTLINPQMEFSDVNTRIHKLTAEIVAGSPTFPAAFPELLSKISSKLVVSYTDFDRSCFVQALDHYRLSHEPVMWLDGSIIVRNVWPEFAEKYSLKDVAKQFEIKFHHHDAIEDSRVAGVLIHKALQYSNTSIEHWFKKYGQIIKPSKRVWNNLPTKKVVIDGYHNSSKVYELIRTQGYEIKRDIVYGVDILIVDELDQDTSKANKARKYIGNGAEILILTADQFLADPCAEFVRQIVSPSEPLPIPLSPIQKRPAEEKPNIFSILSNIFKSK